MDTALISINSKKITADFKTQLLYNNSGCVAAKMMVYSVLCNDPITVLFEYTSRITEAWLAASTINQTCFSREVISSDKDRCACLTILTDMRLCGIHCSCLYKRNNRF